MKAAFIRLSITFTALVGITLAHAEEAIEEAQLPLQELRTFTRVFDQIRQSYVEEIDDKTLLENAIIGMLAELDPHSTYLNQEDFNDLQEHSSGEFGGLGIEVSMEHGLIKIITPIDDTPAARAGIQAGDLIIKLDEQLVQGMNLQQAIELMRGPKGSTIVLTILRASKDAPLEIEIVRDIIKVHSVRNRILEPGYGYVRIAQFQENTGTQFTIALKNLLADKQPLKGIILDLRNNPGGLLGASIEVVDALIDEGLIVSTKGRIESSNSQFSATSGDLLNGLPIVVIINGGSASAAEIVAGALQDHQRALIIGTESFGKGSVQSVLPISEGRAIKLTTARYFTPSGRSIQAEGIRPDIEIQDAELHVLDSPSYIKEKNLAGHLDNGNSSRTKPDKTAQLADDHQLYEALNLLKAVTILSSTTTKTEN